VEVRAISITTNFSA
jgi:serine/threonine protein kinase